MGAVVYKHVAHPRGFTLIEVLVVLLIMGLFAGFASALMQPNDQERLGVEAERLALLLQLVSLESRLTGQTIVWTAEASRYQFTPINTEAALPVTPRQDLLRARKLPENMQISDLHIENIPVDGVMRLAFTPDNPLFSFYFRMSLGTAQYTLMASPIGEISLLPGT